MFPHQKFVLHSAYPDKTWRGIEKCDSTLVEDGARGRTAIVLFDSREDAETCLTQMPEDQRPYFTIVEVTLVTPSVRGPLDSATHEKVAPLIL